MSDGILLVGGYGAVGAAIAARLMPGFEEQIIIAGRNEARARAFASTLGSRVRWLGLDLTRREDFKAVLAGVACVVACLDMPDTAFVSQCLRLGVHYVDISADYPILSAIGSLDEMAQQSGSTAILSVGLVPGLSNLLARHSLNYVSPIGHFDAALLTGLGEKHGIGGTSWILKRLTECMGSKRFYFQQPYHHRTTYRFAFSDQFTLPNTLPIAEAATWMGFDSWLVTHLIGMARLPVLRQLFQQPSIQRLFLKATQRWQFGSDEFVLAACATGAACSYRAWLRGQSEVKITALVAAEVIRRIAQNSYPAGVHHIEQLFCLEDFLTLLERHGTVFSDTAERPSL
jgi:saccharopine dehydrogenase-like NADP-dependent oxidoreductase